MEVFRPHQGQKQKIERHLPERWKRSGLRGGSQKDTEAAASYGRFFVIRNRSSRFSPLFASLQARENSTHLQG